MKDEELDQEIARAKARKAKLQQLLKLSRQIHLLECKYFLGHHELTVVFDRISEIVTKHFKVPVSCVVQRSLKEIYVIPRHAVFFLVREITKASFENIGQVVKRDHTVVLNACQRTQDRIDTDKNFASQIDLLRLACSQESNGHDNRA